MPGRDAKVVAYPMKWILAAVAAILIGAFVLWQRSAVKSSYVNGLDAYHNLPNQEYILEKDCYIFSCDKHSHFPFMAAHDTVPGLPEEVDKKNVGQEFGDIKIIDIAKTGSHFRIVSVRRDDSRTGTEITFEVLFRDELERAFPRVDCYYMLDHTPEAKGQAPAFLVRYAVLNTDI